MILQIRLFRLVWELLWVKGFLVGFTLPDGACRALGLNLGPFTICIYIEAIPAHCKICRRPLRWGLHGKIGKRSLCKPRAYKCCDVWCRDNALAGDLRCEFHSALHKRSSL
jgi:hypothetical protein